MNKWLPLESYASDITSSINVLGDCLREGTLSLFLGAGVSLGTGLPNWFDLVKACGAAVGMPPIQDSDIDSTEKLTRLTDKIQKSAGTFARFAEIVRVSLYQASSGDDLRLFSDPLLMALGSLLMKSRRGSVSDVVTFNFDDVLERYLALHGFASQVITKLPVLFKAVDVTIHHPHGFVSNVADDWRQSDFLIFSKDSFDNRLGEGTQNPWTALTQDMLLKKVGLFIGLSTAGPNIGPLMTQVRKHVGATRPTGFWFIGPKDQDTHVEQVKDWGGVAIPIKSYSDIPHLILRICQYAGRSL